MTPTRALVAALLALAAVPALAAEEVLLLQTQESAAVPATCSTGEDIILGAFVYAPRTRAMDGQVMKELGNPVGTVVGCGTLPSPITLGAKAPFRMDFDLGGRRIVAKGECTVSDLFRTDTVPAAILMLVGCSLRVSPDDDQALVHGVATSASVFMRGTAPGYQTGSFWTLHLYTKD